MTHVEETRFYCPAFGAYRSTYLWFTPRYAEEDVAYYRSVFCVIDHQDSRAFLRDMENMIEGGNSDYALHKTHYVPALGQRMLDTWQQLTPEEQKSISQHQQRCRQLMSEKQRPD